MNSDNVPGLQRIVNCDLFPVCEKKLTLDWARSTYKHYHLFDESILTTTYNDESDLSAWIEEAKNIIKDIKVQGTQSGRDEIVRIATHQYNIFLPRKKQRFF